MLRFPEEEVKAPGAVFMGKSLGNRKREMGDYRKEKPLSASCRGLSWRMFPRLLLDACGDPGGLRTFKAEDHDRSGIGAEAADPEAPDLLLIVPDHGAEVF